MEQKTYLSSALSEFHITLSEKQLTQLLQFYEMLIEKNKVMNLTAITDFSQVVTKHFLDSLSICKVDFESIGSPFQTDEIQGSGQREKLRLIDVGCGAGFPGMVLAIAYPDLQVTLLDSLQKRVGFLNEMIEKLALANCTAIHFRAEEAARMPEHREQYDFAVSRAVANLSTLSEYCLPYVKKGGFFVAYKSEKIKQEAPAAQNAIKLLGGSFESQTEFYLPDLSAAQETNTLDISENREPDQSADQMQNYRNLYVIRKTGNTSKKYPRKAPLPAKQPL